MSVVSITIASRCTSNAAVREPLNKSTNRDAVENVVLVDNSTTLDGGDESGETADVFGVGVAEQGKADEKGTIILVEIPIDRARLSACSEVP